MTQRHAICSVCHKLDCRLPVVWNPGPNHPAQGMPEETVMVCEETAYGSTVRLSFGIYVF